MDGRALAPVEGNRKRPKIRWKRLLIATGRGELRRLSLLNANEIRHARVAHFLESNRKRTIANGARR
jgi:hypothetical protein